MDITKPYNYFEYVIESLKHLDGSGGNAEILEKIIKLAKLSKKEAERLHLNGPYTIVAYKVAWAKTYLKKLGYVENSSRSVWSLTKKGYSEKLLTKTEFNEWKKSENKKFSKTKNKEDDSSNEESDDWIESLTKKMRSLSPVGFERLCQRLFREKGFVKTEVTGRSGDGGIDGTGILKISLLSFKVLFQCKRYAGSVGPSAIRDFRGALSGQADKGIFLTTGSFTTSAKNEASRAGAEQIELIDGVEICNLLKELKLGVKQKEVIIIDEEWFNNFT